LKDLPQDSPEIQAKKKQQQEEEEKKIQEQKSTDDSKKVVKKADAPVAPSFKIKAGLEEFQIILGSKSARLFDIQVQGLNSD
jgi:hypothetical protein